MDGAHPAQTDGAAAGDTDPARATVGGVWQWRQWIELVAAMGKPLVVGGGHAGDGLTCRHESANLAAAKADHGAGSRRGRSGVPVLSLYSVDAGNDPTQ